MLTNLGPDDAPGDDGQLDSTTWASKLIAQVVGRPSNIRSLLESDVVRECTARLAQLSSRGDRGGAEAVLSLLGVLGCPPPESCRGPPGLPPTPRGLSSYGLLSSLEGAVGAGDAVSASALVRSGADPAVVPVHAVEVWLASPSFNISRAAIDIIVCAMSRVDSEGLDKWEKLGVWAVEKLLLSLGKENERRTGRGVVREVLKSLTCAMKNEKLLGAAISRDAISTLLETLECYQTLGGEVSEVFESLLSSAVVDIDLPRIVTSLSRLLLPTEPMYVRLRALKAIKAGTSRLSGKIFSRGPGVLGQKETKMLLESLLRGVCAPQKILRVLSHSILRAAALPSRPLARDILAVMLPTGMALGCVWGRLVARFCVNRLTETLEEACEALGGLANAALDATQTERWTIIAILCDTLSITEHEEKMKGNTARGRELVEGMQEKLISPLLSGCLSAPCCALLANLVAGDEEEGISDEPEALSPLTPSAPVLRDSCPWGSVVNGIFEAACKELARRDSLSRDGLLDVLVNCALWIKSHERDSNLVLDEEMLSKLLYQCKTAPASVHCEEAVCPCAQGLRALAVLGEIPGARGQVAGAVGGAVWGGCGRCRHWAARLPK